MATAILYNRGSSSGRDDAPASADPDPGVTCYISPAARIRDALALAELARSARPLAIITETAQDAQRLREEIAFFAPALRVSCFPDWETLPYDSFSPHQDLVSERLATLWQMHARRVRRR